MKLVYASSPSHDLLKEQVFLATLCEAWELIEIRFGHSGNGNFRTACWSHVISGRVGQYLNIIKRFPGEIVVFSDVDIQWFGPVQEKIRQLIVNKDILFQRESAWEEVVNGGFVIVRCNPRTGELYRRLAEESRKGRLDQDVFNDMIARRMLNCDYGLLPIQFANDNLTSQLASPKEAVLYHSIGTVPSMNSSVQIKLEKHLSMRAQVLGPSRTCILPGDNQPTQRALPSPFRVIDLTESTQRQPGPLFGGQRRFRRRIAFTARP